MTIVHATNDDIPLLAKMNQHLIEDEKAETNLSLYELEERMRDFIDSEYKAFLFYQDKKVIGYALCNVERTPVYLRQFFIDRDERRKGYGKQAFHILLMYLKVPEIDIDVYSWNEIGLKFWESLGFEKRHYNMRYKR